MEMKSYWSRHGDQALQYTGTVGPVVQRRNINDERRIEPEITRVWDVRSALYSGCHSQRPVQEHRHQVGSGCEEGCGESCKCQETLILRTCRSHASFTHPKHHAVWKDPGEKTCWKTKEKVAWQRKRRLPSSWFENGRCRSTGKRPSAVEKCCPLAAWAHDSTMSQKH